MNMLEAQLLQQIENLSNLQKTLQEEKRCLTEKDFSSLNDTLFNKQKSLQTIATLDKRLTTAKSLEAIQQSEPLMALKIRIEADLKSCQKLNDINGKLVAMSMRSNKHLMQLITQAKGQNSVTYDQKGLLKGGRLLGKDIQA